MSTFDAIILLAGGLFAGVVNAMAGGGSLLTVPLLSLAGVEGLDANGTNRVAVGIQTLASGLGFHRKGARPYEATKRVVPQGLLGGLAGAALVSQLDDAVFERLFGVLMIPLLAMALWKPKPDSVETAWPRWVQFLVFFGVGFYAGAIQAGVGLILLLVLTRAGFDLVTGNAVKTFFVIAITFVVALPVFLWNDQVQWVPALVLSAGTGLGGFLGARIAVDGGDRVIKPVLVVAVIALAGRMIGLY